jgi:glutaredoxin 3
VADVHLYTSDACSYCVRAKGLLDGKGVAYTQTHIALDDFEARQRLAELTGRFTVPQILIDGAPIGGWVELSALEHAGRLDDLVNGG